LDDMGVSKLSGKVLQK